MRLRKRSLKKCYLKKLICEKNSEGVSTSNYGESVVFNAETYPISGRIHLETYGKRIEYMCGMNYQGSVEMNEGDGICIGNDKKNKADFTIISITNHSFHKVILLERKY